jgi:hypothetical protein
MFGTSDINVLVLYIVYQNISFTVLFKMMQKFSDESKSERIEVMKRFIELFGIDTI